MPNPTSTPGDPNAATNVSTPEAPAASKPDKALTWIVVILKQVIVKLSESKRAAFFLKALYYGSWAMTILGVGLLALSGLMLLWSWAMVALGSPSIIPAILGVFSLGLGMGAIWLGQQLFFAIVSLAVDVAEGAIKLGPSAVAYLEQLGSKELKVEGLEWKGKGFDKVKSAMTFLGQNAGGSTLWGMSVFWLPIVLTGGALSAGWHLPIVVLGLIMWLPGVYVGFKMEKPTAIRIITSAGYMIGAIAILFMWGGAAYDSPAEAAGDFTKHYKSYFLGLPWPMDLAAEWWLAIVAAGLFALGAWLNSGTPEFVMHGTKAIRVRTGRQSLGAALGTISLLALLGLGAYLVISAINQNLIQPALAGGSGGWRSGGVHPGPGTPGAPGAPRARTVYATERLRIRNDQRDDAWYSITYDGWADEKWLGENSTWTVEGLPALTAIKVHCKTPARGGDSEYEVELDGQERGTDTLTIVRDSKLKARELLGKPMDLEHGRDGTAELRIAAEGLRPPRGARPSTPRETPPQSSADKSYDEMPNLYDGSSMKGPRS